MGLTNLFIYLFLRRFIPRGYADRRPVTFHTGNRAGAGACLTPRRRSGTTPRSDENLSPPFRAPVVRPSRASFPSLQCQGLTTLAQPPRRSQAIYLSICLARLRPFAGRAPPARLVSARAASDSSSPTPASTRNRSARSNCRSLPSRRSHLASRPASSLLRDIVSKSRGDRRSGKYRRRSAFVSEHIANRWTGVCSACPQLHRGDSTSGTLHLCRNAFRPILPVRICVRAVLSCLRKP